MTEPDANGWYPIETAPDDMDEVDLWGTCSALEIHYPYRMAECFRCEGLWLNSSCTPIPDFIPTHYRPVPKPPVEFEEKGDG